MNMQAFMVRTGGDELTAISVVKMQRGEIHVQIQLETGIFT